MDITKDWLESLDILRRSGNSFATTFLIYGLTTKIEFIYEKVGSVRVYLHQKNSYSNIISNTILLGIVRSNLEAVTLFEEVTRGYMLV